MTNYAYLRTQAHHSLTDAKMAGAHNLRLYETQNIKPPKHIDQERSKNNQILFGPSGPEDRPIEDIVADKITEAKAAGQRQRKDQRYLAEQIYQWSRPALEDGTGAIDQAKLQNFATATKQWAQDKFGANLISMVLHMDEASPHIHALFVPQRPDGSISYKEIFGGHKNRLSEFQDSYAAAMKLYGLERGIPKEDTDPKHDTVEQYRDKLRNNTRERLKLETTLAEVETPELPSPKWYQAGWIKESVAVDAMNEMRERVTATAKEALEKAQLATLQAEEERNRLRAKIIEEYKPLHDDNDALRQKMERFSAELTKARQRMAQLYNDNLKLKAKADKAEEMRLQITNDYYALNKLVKDGEWEKLENIRSRWITDDYERQRQVAQNQKQAAPKRKRQSHDNNGGPSMRM